MAVYSGTPTVNGQWEEGSKQGQYIRYRKNLTITLTSQGGASNTIGAVALGFKAGTLQMVIPVLLVVSSTNRACWLFTDGTNVYVGDPTQATDANRGVAGDVTGTLTFEVAGQPYSP